MPTRALVLASALVTALIGPGQAVISADEAVAGPGSHASVLVRALRTRLSIGARLTRLALDDSRRYGANRLDNHNTDVNFLGSLWGLDPRQGLMPAPFLEYRVVAGIGAGVAYDEARIKTLDWANDEHSAIAGDGDLRVRGARLYAFGRFRNRTRLTPFIRGGFSRYWSAFFEDPGWALPGRFFEVKDTRGLFCGGGLSVTMWRQLALEASVERSWLKDVNASAHFLSGNPRRGVFPMRNTALRVGIAYGF